MDTGLNRDCLLTYHAKRTDISCWGAWDPSWWPRVITADYWPLWLVSYSARGHCLFYTLVHKGLLFAKASEDIFPYGKAEAHYIIFSRSLQALSKTLDWDMHNLRALGYPAERIEQPDQDPLAVSRYSCIYWVDHLCNSDPKSSANHGVGLQDGGAVHKFIRKKYLYWLEALSLCKSMSKFQWRNWRL